MTKGFAASSTWLGKAAVMILKAFGESGVGGVDCQGPNHYSLCLLILIIFIFIFNYNFVGF